jgi:threonine dehydrogenase-like Zn-dependent dehydrogenase
MKAAVYTQGAGFAVQDAPVPAINEDELLLKVVSASICGTDTRTIGNGHRKLGAGQRLILGHEFAGVLEQVGSRVQGYRTGMRIGVAPNIGCARCAMCVRGLPNMCPDYEAFGITFDGGLAEYVRIPAGAIAQGSVVPLPDGLSWEHAPLIEPLSCVVNGIRASRVGLGDTVVIFGAGPIGLMHLALARHSGAARVVVADVQGGRLAKARELGATETVLGDAAEVRRHVLALTGGYGADVVITACPVREVAEQAPELLAPFGRLCLFGGLPKDDPYIRLDANLVHYKNLFVTGVTGGSPCDFRTALALIAANIVPLKAVISRVMPMDRMEEAFRLALGGEAKIVLQAEH